MIMDAGNTPPTDDVREALALAIRKGSGASKYQSELLADQMLPHLAAFEVRPRGTITDAEVAQEAYRRYDGDTIIDEDTGEPTSHDDWGYAECQRQAFAAGVAWAREARQ